MDTTCPADPGIRVGNLQLWQTVHLELSYTGNGPLDHPFWNSDDPAKLVLVRIVLTELKIIKLMIESVICQ